MILLHDRTGNVEARATGRWLLLDPILGSNVFDRVRSLLRRLSTRGNGQGFIVKDTTRLAPKKLIHREAIQSGLLGSKNQTIARKSL